MNDMQRDADRVGRRIWPDPGPVLERVTGGGGGGRVNTGPRRGLVVGLATAAGLVAVLATALALRGGGNATPGGAGALASSTSSALTTITAAPVTPATAPSGGSATATASTAGSATVVPPRTPGPTPIPTPPSGGAVALTAADSGRTISVHVGTSIVVTLSSTGGPYRWTEPDTSNGAAVTRTGGSANSDGSAAGTFTAVAAGNADLTAVDSPSCSPPCGAPSRLWKVSIVVTP